MKKLYTTKEIVELYGNITPSTVTEKWIPAGLKHIRGKRNSYLYKLEWVEEFIEQQANNNIIDSNNNTNIQRSKKDLCTYKIV